MSDDNLRWDEAGGTPEIPQHRLTTALRAIGAVLAAASLLAAFFSPSGVPSWIWFCAFVAGGAIELLGFWAVALGVDCAIAAARHARALREAGDESDKRIRSIEKKLDALLVSAQGK